MPLQRDFVFEKATKNTYRFVEKQEPGTADGQGIAVGVLYVQKSQFAKQPTRLHVIIEDESEPSDG